MAEKNYRAELVGVFGDPVDGNPTCVIEEAAFAAANLNWRYLTCRVRPGDLGDAIAGMRAMNMRGINLTMPHKIDVIPYLDSMSEAAELIGAVNTVAVRDGKLFGDNTDGRGFVQSLRDEEIPLKGRTITILGAGGAAKAIGVECALAGVKKINIVNRNAERGKALAETINARTNAKAEYFPWNGTAQIPDGTEILINATCVGLFPNVDEVPDVNFDQITPDMLVCDVVFNPVLPLFLKRAREKGAKIITGIGMLVNQGALNYKIWTGLDADRKIMMDALVKEFTE